MNIDERFSAKVDVVEASGCWHWTGHVRANGYGQFSVDKRARSAHRWAYERFVGPIPLGKEIDHLCHGWDDACSGGSSCLHRRCVNPEHLEAVVHKVNSGRGLVGKNQPRRSSCVNGHRYDENLYITPAGRRSGCRTCRIERSREWKKQRSAA